MSSEGRTYKIVKDWEKVLAMTDTTACDHNDVREWAENAGYAVEDWEFTIIPDPLGDYEVEDSCLILPAELIEEVM